MTAHLDPTARHDFLMLYDVTGGNPNGDPDNGNSPRVDPETMHGWVTDAAIKRKARNFIAESRADQDGFGIHVAEGVALNARMREASKKLDMEPNKKRPRAEQQKVADLLCTQWWDIRTFGGVLSTGDNPAGQVRGPIQLGLSRSVDPLFPADLTITRVAVTDEKELEKMAAGDGGKDREMGSKSLVPYALFRTPGFFVPSLAKRTGFSGEDLAIWWDTLQRMWSLDRSASRGVTGCRGIHIFSHDDPYGSVHADRLFSAVETKLVSPHPRNYADYEVKVDRAALPDGVTHTFLGVDRDVKIVE